jgi:transcription antitermination factor NusG
MNIEELNYTILSGEADEFLDSIVKAVKIRKDALKPQIWEFQVGDKVKIINANPKYLNGSTATIKKVNRTKVVIDLDTPNGKFSHNITTPLGMLEKI